MTYRPPQWQTPSTSRVLLVFPGQPQSSPFSGAAGISAVLPNSQTNYVFDATLTVAHEQEVTPTEHPVQTGASISDHAYIRPARLIMEIGMSDVMDAFYNPSTWSGAPSKSVSTFQTLLAIQFARIPVSVTTRMRSYTNMLIRGLNTQETFKTIRGLRARLEFFQLFMATVLQSNNSARAQDTGNTNLGSVTPTPITPTQLQQNGVANLAGNNSFPVVPSTAIGAGGFSSVNTNNLTMLPGR